MKSDLVQTKEENVYKLPTHFTYYTKLRINKVYMGKEELVVGHDYQMLGPRTVRLLKDKPPRTRLSAIIKDIRFA